MPIVPIYQNTTKTDVSYTSGAEPAANLPPAQQEQSVPEDLQQSLADSVKHEVRSRGTVSTNFLDQFAASHFRLEQTNVPAAWDYAALRQTALQEETETAYQQQLQKLQDQGNWINKIGSLCLNEQSLQAYLTLQIPAYQTRLEQVGQTEEQARSQAEELRVTTIENHILRSLSGGNWPVAQAVFSAQHESLPEENRRRLAQQIRQTFVVEQGKNLWQQAKRKGHAAQEREEYAMSLIEESDEDLKAGIRQEINRLAQKDLQQNALEQAQLFDQLAQASSENLMALIHSQQVLQAPSLKQAFHVAQHIDQEASEAQQEWFVKNYFNPDTDVENSFKRGLCTARDYFRLKAIQKHRQSGQINQNEGWLLRGINTWMHKQGFNEKDIMRASYAVLTGPSDNAQRLNIWKQIKTLLTC
ncbi:MAG: hypothetical protein IKP96_06685 [Elusimicrobiaceae bacterium]|nr:hypothetical protein [Elusimicrobiaceae bacterium]